MNNRYFDRLSWIIAAVIAVAPSNLFWQIPLGSPYVSGLRIDYLIPKLHGSFLLLLFLMAVVAAPSQVQFKKLWLKITPVQVVGIILMFTILIKQCLLTSNLAATLHLVVLWLTGTVGALVLRSAAPKLQHLPIVTGLLISASWQTFLGWWQFITQRSFAEYHWFGEPNLQNWNGITKAVLWGREVSLPYGSTTHPNVLANILVILWWLSWLWLKQQNKDRHYRKIWIYWQILSLPLITLVLITQSMSGLICLFFAAMFMGFSTMKLYSKKQYFSLQALGFAILILSPFVIAGIMQLLPNLSRDLSWQRRQELFEVNQLALKENLVWGVGINQLTTWIVHHPVGVEIVRFIQPTHNVFWLFFGETGIMGLLIIGIWWQQSYHQATERKYSVAELAWILLLPAAALDHFWITQWPGILMAAILIGLTQSSLKTR